MCVCVCVCVCARVCLCDVVFIHSSVDGHLGCFHILTTVKNAANEYRGAFIFFD